MINEKWVGDITYIYTLKHGWCYLASFMDLQTKKIIGYSFGRTMTTELIIKALNNAHEAPKPGKDLIFHSDLGTQYTSEAFGDVIQSFHATLKKEEVNHIQYIDYKSTKLALFQYIEGWYNCT